MPAAFTMSAPAAPRPPAPKQKAVLAPVKSLHGWSVETTDGTWAFAREEDEGTTWTVRHLPTGTVVADFLGSLRQCRAYVGSGDAQDALERLQAVTAAGRAQDAPVPGEEACPVYRPGDDGTPWPCVLGMDHNNPGQDPDYDDQATVHRDQSGTEFRVARCQDPAAHGMPHCWCAIPAHHKPIKRDEETG
jgi:hypothetical protein